MRLCAQVIETQHIFKGISECEPYRVTPASKDHGPALADDARPDDGDLLLGRHLAEVLDEKIRFRNRLQRLKED